VIPKWPYHRRVVDTELDELLADLAAISLEGAKAVGKTATATQRAASIYELDRADVRELVSADPDRVLSSPPPVLLDEWQRLPAVWDAVRRAVDEDPSSGRFLLTGSASPASPQTHSGAGRIVRMRMRPLSLVERDVATPTVSLALLLAGGRPVVDGSSGVRLERYVEEIVASGFPGIRPLGERARRAQLDGYLARIVDRDFTDMGRSVRNPIVLRRWMAAYAAATATVASYDSIRGAATGGEGDKPAKTTTQPYRDILERLWVVDPVPAWTATRNYLHGLGSAPKHHLADPALAARILGLDASALLEGRAVEPTFPRDGSFLGALFESLVTLDVRVYAQAAEARVGHLRTHRGAHEVDLIVARADQSVVAIEVKLASAVNDHDVRHLRWLQEEIGDRLLDAVVITTGDYAYRRPDDGIAVIPAALLGP
jgi:predicted AAA+ superfamily ATPase